MRKPSDKRGKAIIKACEDAGWRVVEVKDGWRLLAPDGTTTCILHTSMNQRTYQNLAARLRRFGVKEARA